MITIVPADDELIREFYEGREEPVPTLRAFVVLEDGKAVAVTGFVRHRRNVMTVFSDIKGDAAQRHKKTALKVARFIVNYGQEKGWSLRATADGKMESAPRLLTRLGFRFEEGEYVI